MTQAHIQEQTGIADDGVLELPVTSIDGQARAAAMHRSRTGQVQPTGAVAYTSAGALLIIGPRARVTAAADTLKDALDCTRAITDAEIDVASSGAATIDGTPVVYAAPTRLRGYLGHFNAFVRISDDEVNLSRLLGRRRLDFDLVLDFGAPPLMRYTVPPPGYYAPGDDPWALDKALDELPEMVGEFEKPTYFKYNPNICAHGASGIEGCTRCLATCPTGAIGSLKALIQIDPYLCQGGGSCATACPTGAITYAYPTPSDLLETVKQALKAYREADGRRPSLLFHDGEQGRGQVAKVSARLPEWLIPVQVEDIGAIGMDIWLAALAYGASEVLLLATEITPRAVLDEIHHQVACAQAILTGMAYDGRGVRLLTPAADELLIEMLQGSSDQERAMPAGFATHNEKRNTLRMALNHLYEQAPRKAAAAALPAGAPFGEVVVDREACTLCMACTSVCPTSALLAGDDVPRLSFIEWNCVQCGLCETACPEDAITLIPRIVYDPESRAKRRTLNEEQPFCCISCGKPFATKRMMDKMTAKLSGHWMFQDPQALRRIQMCDACRVTDMFSRDLTPDVYRRPPAR